ncbi:Vasorin, partial [Ophiophagus hannah]
TTTVSITLSGATSPQGILPGSPGSTGPPSPTSEHQRNTSSLSLTTSASHEETVQSTSLSTASATDLLPPKCLNGGFPIGDHCKCLSPYMEPFCKEARNEVIVGKFSSVRLPVPTK